MSGENIINAEKSFEIQKLKEEIKQLKNDINKYRILIKDLDPDADTSDISDEEAICVEQIRKLKEYSSQRELTPDEIKNLDILHKNLKLARGEAIRSNSGKKAKGASKEELEKIIKGE